MKPDSAFEADTTDLRGSGDLHEESEDDKMIESEDDKMIVESDDIGGQKGIQSPSSNIWDDDDDEIEKWSDLDRRLPKVLKAFVCLKEDFDSKFKQMWA
jgi:hypothetical protein